ncbi:Serine/threonine-protein kinase EDR1 [Bienertia sinuspersici]
MWNVQGTGDRAFLAALRETMRINQPNVLALVETHMGGDHVQRIATMLGYNGHTRVDAQGFSGGIWIYWRHEIVIVKLVRQHNQYIIMEISRNRATPWYFTTVYASPDPTQRQNLWKELRDFAINYGSLVEISMR